MSVIHIYGNEEEIKYTQEILKMNFNEVFIPIFDFSIALSKINSRDSFILLNFIKSQRYQISCKTRQLKIPNLTIIFNFNENLESPNIKNKFDNPLLKVNKIFSNEEIQFISKCLNRKIIKESKAHFREILDDDYLEKVNEIIEKCISKLNNLNIKNINYIINEVRNMFFNKINVKKIEISNVKSCFMEMINLELIKII